jgi:hypothetical protein
VTLVNFSPAAGAVNSLIRLKPNLRSGVLTCYGWHICSGPHWPLHAVDPRRVVRARWLGALVIRVIASSVLVLALVLCGAAKGADAPDSYRSITLREFESAGPSLAKQSARVEITGAYSKPGTVDLLYADRASAVTSTESPKSEDARRIPFISLLTDQASHAARAALLDCRTRNDVGCAVTLRGQVTMCTITNSLGSSQQFACLDVRDGGLVSSQVSPGIGLLERAQPSTAAVAASAPENPAKPPEPTIPPPPVGPASDATCYGYIGFIASDGRFAVSVVGPFNSSTCTEQFDTMKTTVPSPIEGGRMVVSNHGNARSIEATVRYGLHCEAVNVGPPSGKGGIIDGVEHDPRGLAGIYQCLRLGP